MPSTFSKQGNRRFWLCESDKTRTLFVPPQGEAVLSESNVVYRLQQSAQVNASAAFAVRVSASNVVLDMCSLSLAGAGSSESDTVGVLIDDGVRNVVIRNGSLRHFGGGGLFARGEGQSVIGLLLSDLLVEENGASDRLADAASALSPIKCSEEQNAIGAQGGLTLRNVSDLCVERVRARHNYGYGALVYAAASSAQTDIAFESCVLGDSRAGAFRQLESQFFGPGFCLDGVFAAGLLLWTEPNDDVLQFGTITNVDLANCACSNNQASIVALGCQMAPFYAQPPGTSIRNSVRDVRVQNCRFDNQAQNDADASLGTTFSNYFGAAGLLLDSCNNVDVSNCFSGRIRAQSPNSIECQAFRIENCTNAVLRNTQAADVLSFTIQTPHTAGFALNGFQISTIDCVAQQISNRGQTGELPQVKGQSAFGFLATGNANTLSMNFQSCIASNVTSAAPPLNPDAESAGFGVQAPFPGAACFNACKATGNSVGFNISKLAQNQPTLCYAVTNCTAMNNTIQNYLLVTDNDGTVNQDSPVFTRNNFSVNCPTIV